MYTLDQLRAAAAILSLPLYKSKAALNEELLDALRKNKRELEKVAPTAATNKSLSRKKAPAKKVQTAKKTVGKKSRSMSRKHANKSRRMSKSLKEAKSRKRTSKSRKNMSKSRKGAKSRRTSKSREGAKSSKQVRELYLNAIGRVGEQGYREVVAALANPKEQKIWILMRKPKTSKPQDRATLWGQSGSTPRHLYGGERFTDAELVESKLKKGYQKEPALLRLARAAVQK